ncbi:hypothetical protein KIH79_05845 [Bifidobacterium sp. 82T10]|uniref:Alpha-L-arabinofuranosidase C-terminal domain-containing protein n=1 Tax=Bifidobacterium miconis TaxID=2834435 RepID=A0ABS6WEK7_9BIFI|nr:alpha-L-arabinofuranosidase C-terminal domain-containing protein [Bifidobacterium miconis]MBW3092473.1 hypothetical protein [Bifidobacterium miconis]
MIRREFPHDNRFIANVGLYDAYRADDGWPRAFLGEYSSRDRKWRNALTEAAYLTGVERSPAIGLACYAPMLCNTAYANWDPDMIYFDNHRVYGTPSYWVQRMFMTGQGTQLLESGDDMQPAAVEPPSLAGLLRMTTARAVVDVTDFVVRDANGSVIARQDAFTIDPDHPERICGDMPSDRYTVECSFVRRNGDHRATSAVVESIEGAALDDVNDFDEPERVAPRQRVVDVRDGSIDVVATPYSFLMLRIR